MTQQLKAICKEDISKAPQRSTVPKSGGSPKPLHPNTNWPLIILTIAAYISLHRSHKSAPSKLNLTCSNRDKFNCLSIEKFHNKANGLMQHGYIHFSHFYNLSSCQTSNYSQLLQFSRLNTVRRYIPICRNMKYTTLYKMNTWILGSVWNNWTRVW